MLKKNKHKHKHKHKNKNKNKMQQWLAQPKRTINQFYQKNQIEQLKRKKQQQGKSYKKRLIRKLNQLKSKNRSRGWQKAKGYSPEARVQFACKIRLAQIRKRITKGEAMPA